MASLSHDRNRSWRIQFASADDGRRRLSIRLGGVTKKQALTVLHHVEQLVTAKITGHPPEDLTARWVAAVSDELHSRLARTGLVRSRGRVASSLDELLRVFFDSLTVKPITVLGYQSTRKSLLADFGAARATSQLHSLIVASVRPARFNCWRQRSASRGVTWCGRSSHAIRWKMAADNPFSDVRAGSQQNRARMSFITGEQAEKVLAACPDAVAAPVRAEPIRRPQVPH
jgi:hypothetical protein